MEVELTLADAVSVETGEFQLDRWMEVGPLLAGASVEVRKLHIVDRRPLEVSEGEMYLWYGERSRQKQGCYMWELSPRTNWYGGCPSRVPYEIFIELEECGEPYLRVPERVGYFMRWEAAAALAEACRRWAWGVAQRGRRQEVLRRLHDSTFAGRGVAGEGRP